MKEQDNIALPDISKAMQTTTDFEAQDIHTDITPKIAARLKETIDYLE